jgi:hypothetical protein
MKYIYRISPDISFTLAVQICFGLPLLKDASSARRGAGFPWGGA